MTHTRPAFVTTDVSKPGRGGEAWNEWPPSAEIASPVVHEAAVTASEGDTARFMAAGGGTLRVVQVAPDQHANSVVADVSPVAGVPTPTVPCGAKTSTAAPSPGGGAATLAVPNHCGYNRTGMAAGAIPSTAMATTSPCAATKARSSPLPKPAARARWPGGPGRGTAMSPKRAMTKVDPPVVGLVPMKIRGSAG